MNTKVGKKGNLGGKIDPNFVNRIRASKFSNMKLGPEIKIRSRLVEDYLDSNKPNKPNKYSKIANMVKRFGTVMALASTIAFNTSLKNKNVNYNPSIKSNKPAIVKVVDNVKNKLAYSVDKVYAEDSSSRKEEYIERMETFFQYLELEGLEETLRKYPNVAEVLRSFEKQGYIVSYELSSYLGSFPETFCLDKLKLVDNEEEFKSLFVFNAERPVYPISDFYDTSKKALDRGGFRLGSSKIAALAVNGDQWVFAHESRDTVANILVAVNKKELKEVAYDRNRFSEYMKDHIINKKFPENYIKDIKRSGLDYKQAWIYFTPLPDGSGGLIYISSVESWVLKIYADRVEKLSCSYAPFMLAGIKGDWEVIPRKIDDYNYELTITSKDLADKVRNGEEIPENSRVIVMKVNYKEKAKYGNKECPLGRNFTIYTYGTDPKKAIRWPFDFIARVCLIVLDPNPNIAKKEGPYLFNVITYNLMKDKENTKHCTEKLVKDVYKRDTNANDIRELPAFFTNQFRLWDINGWNI